MRPGGRPRSQEMANLVPVPITGWGCATSRCRATAFALSGVYTRAVPSSMHGTVVPPRFSLCERVARHSLLSERFFTRLRFKALCRVARGRGLSVPDT